MNDDHMEDNFDIEEDGDDQEEEEINQAANAMILNRISPSTRKLYVGLVKKVDEFAMGKGLVNGFPRPITMEFAQSFANDILAKRADNNSIKSDSIVGLYFSAIKFAHTDLDPPIAIPPDVNSYFGKYKKGHKRKLAELKNDGVMKMTEGKEQITFAQLSTILKVTLRSAGDGRYAHLFLSILWTLFARSASVADIHMQFFSLNCDAITIKFPRHKGDQDGRRSFPKHVYGNPYDVNLCIFTAIGMHIYTDLMPDRNTRIFQSGILNSFWRQFGKILNFCDMDISDYDAEDYGTHSIRKGMLSF